MTATTHQPIAVRPTTVHTMTDAMRIAALDVGAVDKLSHQAPAAMGANVQLRIAAVRILERTASPTLWSNPMRPPGQCGRSEKQNDGCGGEQKRFHMPWLRFSPAHYCTGGQVPSSIDRGGGKRRSLGAFGRVVSPPRGFDVTLATATDPLKWLAPRASAAVGRRGVERASGHFRVIATPTSAGLLSCPLLTRQCHRRSVPFNRS
jgi:hypothetical protein